MRLSVRVCGERRAFHFGYASVKRMKSFRMSLINLLMLYVIFTERRGGFCLNTVRQVPKPSISRLQAISEKQTLLVSWLLNYSVLLGEVYEIQIGRTENRTVIYNGNLSLFSEDSEEYTWTWTSDLPLECVDHSVRIRHFNNQSVPSPWSNWITNYGAQAKDKTKMFPIERVLREGASAMFCCVPPRGVDITNITLNNNKFPLIDIGARVKAIAVDNLTIPVTLFKTLSLSCNDTTSNMRWSAWNYISFPPQKPRNLGCVTSDMKTVTCTWDSGRKRSPHDRNKQTRTLRFENSDLTSINCEQSSCTFPAVPQLEEYNISVVVKDQLGEETESYSFNISERVVPVVEWYRVSPGVKETTVFWIVQGNLTHQTVLCQVTTDPGTTSELSCNNVSGICKVKLEHLLPSSRYSARVRCSVNGRLWGVWTQPTSFTTDTLVTLDVWRRIKPLSDPNSRQVMLLWTPHVSGSAAVVNIQGYIVEWSQKDQNWTMWMDGGQTRAEVSITSGQYDFTVKAVLNTGSSIAARITISQGDDGEILPIEKQLHSGTATGFNLSWDKQDTATCGYIVEWCILGNTEPCTLRWKKVPEGNNTLSLPARNFKAGCRYTFNIYGCTEHGHRLLEIQTGYSQELKPVRSPSLVEPASASSSVTLEWRYNEDDQAHPAFITGYLVTGQEVAYDTLPGHANLFNVSVADPHRKYVTIDGLQQNQEYVFSVRALTKEGPGQPASITIRTRTNYSAHLAKILTPSLLLLCCTILLWPQRKMLKSGLKGIFAYPAGMNIKTPDLDSFLHETAERLQSQEVEECSRCDIEILNTGPRFDDTARLSNPDPLDTQVSCGSQSSPSTVSLSCVPLQGDYCPQSVIVLWEEQALQQMTCVSNKSYFPKTEQDLSEVMVGVINKLSERVEIM